MKTKAYMFLGTLALIFGIVQAKATEAKAAETFFCVATCYYIDSNGRAIATGRGYEDKDKFTAFQKLSSECAQYGGKLVHWVIGVPAQNGYVVQPVEEMSPDIACGIIGH